MRDAARYYTVEVALDATWQENAFSYSSGVELPIGTVVVVPFGKKKLLGFVSATTPKPAVQTKPIDTVLDFSMSVESRQLYAWLKQFYPAMPGMHLQHLLPSYVATLQSPTPQKPTTSKTQHTMPQLTPDQTKAVDQLTASTVTSHVLHGITGSGKTRVYAELALQQLACGKNVLLVYPEISLTTQLEETLQGYFGTERVHIFHSRRTPKERKQAWLDVYQASGGTITIGPRSSLFLPHQNLGYVIVDEAHDSAYKQDSDTRYHGLQVAAALARTHQAQLLLGSATPPVQETRHIIAKGGSLVNMHNLAKQDTASQRSIHVIDMTKKTNKHPASHLLSVPLVEAMRKSLYTKKQSLLFLNRRGTARMLLCENCGWHASCPRCDMPLTYHHDTHHLRCHVCGFTDTPPSTCPDCSHELVQRAPGTKAMEQELQKLFPEARIARFDSDNKKADSFAEQYAAVKAGKVDILIGTQLLTKGLDLPLLETVGVLQADSTLLLPDYTSEERAFQQLMQVSGRVGRGHDSGSVFIQTYQDKNPLFELVTRQDWRAFYDHELQRRQAAHYPPATFLMRVWTHKKTPSAAQKAMEKLAKQLSSTPKLTIRGPAPSFYEKTRGKYTWQLIVSSSSRSALVAVARQLPKDVIYDLDPITLL